MLTLSPQLRGALPKADAIHLRLDVPASAFSVGRMGEHALDDARPLLVVAHLEKVSPKPQREFVHQIGFGDRYLLQIQAFLCAHDALAIERIKDARVGHQPIRVAEQRLDEQAANGGMQGIAVGGLQEVDIGQQRFGQRHVPQVGT